MTTPLRRVFQSRQLAGFRASPDLRLLLHQGLQGLQPLLQLRRLEQWPSGVQLLWSQGKPFGFLSIVSERESALKKVLADWAYLLISCHSP